MLFTYKYERPGLSTDCVVFGLDRDGLKVVLIKRKNPPYKNRWALPGGYVKIDEPLAASALRELKEETGIGKIFLEQLYTFGDPGRDPRERSITVAYYALVNLPDKRLRPGSDAAGAAWFPVKKLPPLAFDHGRITAVARARLKSKVRYEPIGFELLPKKFTLSMLQKLYETVLEQKLDKRNFRKKITGMGLLVGLHETEKNVARRPARLYRFDMRKYTQLKKKGFNFEI